MHIWKVWKDNLKEFRYLLNKNFLCGWEAFQVSIMVFQEREKPGRIYTSELLTLELYRIFWNYIHPSQPGQGGSLIAPNFYKKVEICVLQEKRGKMNMKIEKTGFEPPWIFRENFSQKIIFQTQSKFSRPKFIVDFEN